MLWTLDKTEANWDLRPCNCSMRTIYTYDISIQMKIT